MSKMKGLNQLKLELYTAVAFYKDTNESRYLIMVHETLEEIEKTYGAVGLKQLLFESVEDAIKQVTSEFNSV